MTGGGCWGPVHVGGKPQVVSLRSKGIVRSPLVKYALGRNARDLAIPGIYDPWRANHQGLASGNHLKSNRLKSPRAFDFNRRRAPVPARTDRGVEMEQGTNEHDETGAELAPGDELAGQPAGPRPAKRPGCVTAYALILGSVAALVGGAVITGVLFPVVTGDTAFVPAGSLVVLLALAGLEFLIAVGVWRLRNWARTAAMVLHGLGILISLSGLLAILGGADIAFVVARTLIAVGIGGYIIYWFASHGEYFH